MAKYLIFTEVFVYDENKKEYPEMHVTRLNAHVKGASLLW